MADVKTSDETAADALTGAELVRVVQGGNNRKATTQNVADLFDPSAAIASAISDHEAASNPHPGYLTPTEGDAAYQPLNANLTEYAAVTPTAAGLALLDDADVAAQLTTLGLDNTKLATISYIIDGGGSEITTGLKHGIQVDFACTILSVTVLLDPTGDIVVDIWNDTYANFPPTDADSITASAPPTVSGGVKSTDSTLTGWDTAIAAGDILYFNVDSVTDATWALVSLKVRKT